MGKIGEASLSRWARLLFAVAAWSVSNTAFGWIYPEHRDIAVARGSGTRCRNAGRSSIACGRRREPVTRSVCARWVPTPSRESTPDVHRLGGAVRRLPAIIRCSGADMLETVRASGLDSRRCRCRRAAQGGSRAHPGDRDRRTRPRRTPASSATRSDASRTRRVAPSASNALRTADTRMQRADQQYATRADSNLAHFLLPRPNTNLDPLAYANAGAEARVGAQRASASMPGITISAMQKASRLANEQLSAEERRALARAALFDEAFALHFLEDIYAAGHVAGSWGDVSQRKGTHDFYNQNGLEVFTWKGRDRTIVLMGDAHMRPEDAALAADGRAHEPRAGARCGDRAVARLRHSACCRPPLPRRRLSTSARAPPFPTVARASARARAVWSRSLEKCCSNTPVPALGPGLGSQPRSRSEVGAFVGLAASIDGRAVSGGFEASQNENGFVCRSRRGGSRRPGVGGGARGCGRRLGLPSDRIRRRRSLHQQVLGNRAGRDSAGA